MSEAGTDKKAIVYDVISKAIKKPVEEIKPEHDLVADYGIDSVNTLMLLVDLEEKLGIEISDEAAAEIDTVGDILKHLDELDAA